MESSTVFFLPALPMRIPAGIENRANQRKTIMGSVFANEFDRLKSIFTQFVAMPTISTNPMMKKPKNTAITGVHLVCDLCWFILLIFGFFSRQEIELSTYSFNNFKSGRWLLSLYTRCR